MLVKKEKSEDLMFYRMVEMNEAYAKNITKWRYKDHYSVYNFEDNEETLNELLTQEYYAVLDKNSMLIGFFCVKEAAIVPYGKKYHVYDDDNYLDIGLGIKPSLVGKRRGYPYLRFGLDYFKQKYNTNHFRLTVLDFNKRAIHLYHKIGFKIENYFKSQKDHYFLVMTLVD